MKTLIRIATAIDTARVQEALACNQDLWHADVSRQQNIQVQAQTQSIPLRQAVRPPGAQHLATEDIHPSQISPYAWRLPEALLLAQTLASDLGVELGRAMLIRLPSGGSVATHRDAGAYYAIRDRYHLVVAAEPDGNILGAGQEHATLRTGELWWLANKDPHWARNRSAADRIHLVFDVLPSPRWRPSDAPTDPTSTGGTQDPTPTRVDTNHLPPDPTFSTGAQP